MFLKVLNFETYPHNIQQFVQSAEQLQIDLPKPTINYDLIQMEVEFLHLLVCLLEIEIEYYLRTRNLA